MRPSTSLLLALPFVGQALATRGIADSQRALEDTTKHGASTRSFPSWHESAVTGRRLLAKSKFAGFTTTFPWNGRGKDSKALAGVPVSMPDYYADCVDYDSDLADVIGEGNPVVLGLNLAMAFKNVEEGSNFTMTIDWWNYLPKDEDDVEDRPDPRGLIREFEDGEVDPEDLLARSPARLPRMALIGYIERLNNLDEETIDKLENCFVAKHPDSVMWLPHHDNAAHRGFWARLVVQRINWLGSFGDRGRIGWMDVEDWRSVKKSEVDDARLPGEN